MSKRPAVESIPLCCNASVKGGEHWQTKCFFMKIEFDFCCSLCCIKFDSLMLYLPLCSCEKLVWKYKAFKCKKKKKSLPTYPPADSVGRQCQTNNILMVASCTSIINKEKYKLFFQFLGVKFFKALATLFVSVNWDK